MKRILAASILVALAGIVFGQASEIGTPARSGASTQDSAKEKDDSPFKSAAEWEKWMGERPKRIKKFNEEKTKTGFSPSAVNDEQVALAIEKGVSYLLSQGEKGTWDTVAKWPLDTRAPEAFTDGETSLVVFALLTAWHGGDERCSPNSKLLAPVIERLRKLETDKTYVAAMQACALSLLPRKKENIDALKRVVARLEKEASATKGYRYHLPADAAARAPVRADPNAGEAWDNSNSQLAAYAVWAAADSGIEVSKDYWPQIDKFWRTKQCKAGGWAYDEPINEPKPWTFYGENQRQRGYAPPRLFERTAITPAGLATLLMAQDQIGAITPIRNDAVITSALASVEADFGSEHANGYYFFAIERAALAGGWKYFNGVDWYRDVASTLLYYQDVDGSWEYEFGTQAAIGNQRSKNIGTAFALITLIHGRAPILFNKLRYKKGTWDPYPRDNAHITRWLSQKFEKPMNWQIVDLASNPEDWRDAPVLLISGTGDPQFTADEIAKLRQFIELGGTIFSVGGADNAGYTAIMKKYALDAMGNTFEWRQLPAEHPLFSTYFKTKPLPLYGLTNGVREMWIHAQYDLANLWQRNFTAQTNSWEIAANVATYVSGKGAFRNRLKATHDPEPEAAPKRNVSVARIKYAGNWDPEPGAWKRVASSAAVNYSTKVAIENVAIADLKGSPGAVAHLTGTAANTFNDDQIKKLREFCEAGGTLIVDSAGGGANFAKSATEMCVKLWPDNKRVIIPADDPLFTIETDDRLKIGEAKFRKLTVLRDGNLKEPRLEGFKHDGRWAVILSPDDMTAALLGLDTITISGYESETAHALIRNILLDAATRH